MSDLISRQAAIEALKKYEELESNNFTDTSPISMMTVATIANCIEEIVNLPSAEPERKWIPVTERLPEEETDVLVSVHFEGFKGKTVDLPPSDYVEIASHVEGVWSSLSDEYKVAWKKHHVVAWMETPEPWRGE